MARIPSFVWTVALLTCVAGCSSEPEPGQDVVRGDGEFGDDCETSDDCASGLCVRVGSSPALCSKTCSAPEDCPSAANWDCATPSGVNFQVCGCLPDNHEEVCGDGRDNDCDMKVDDCRVCDGEQVPENDHEHCGECGNACRNDQVCDDGMCTCSREDLVECSDKCVDISMDENHCGGCDRACLPGQRCIDGACSCQSVTAPDVCPQDGCVDLESDPDNCGNCGNACRADLVCNEGTCACPSAGATDCPSAGCVDLLTDGQNCGGCGVSCPDGQTCSGGDCGCPQPGPSDYCGGVGCVDLSTDLSNCGSCGVGCGGGKLCQGGTCACPPSAPQDCSGICRDLDSDDDHCGACGHACSVGQVCQGGVCDCYSSGYTACGTACVATDVNPQHCGACDSPCLVGEVCSGGQCVCVSGQHCNGVCTPVDDDLNCGACGNACPVDQQCSAGVCVCVSSGLSICGGSCVDIGTDPVNCGACGTTCKNGESCVTGACTCDSGEAWCQETGTCTDLLSNPEHCGVCGSACRNTEVCSWGTCRCPSYTEEFCASTQQCENLYSSEEHCGACDSACPAETYCQSGHCRCDTYGLALCGQLCVDLDSDVAHCGACEAACQGGMQCDGGNCRCAAPSLASIVQSADVEKFWGYDFDTNDSNIGLVYARGYSGLNCSDVYFTLLNPDGSRVWSDDLQLTNCGSNPYSNEMIRRPRIIWNGSEWGVMWVVGQDTWVLGGTYFQRLALNGTPLGGIFDISAATPGGAAYAVAPKPTASLAYSSTYGYAIVTPARSNRLDFQRLGHDGTQPEPVVQINIDSWSTETVDDDPVLAASPDGWGILVRLDYSHLFVTLDALAASAPVGTVIDGASFNYPYQTFPLVHDGSTWLSVWTRIENDNSSGSLERTGQYVIARGDALQHVQVGVVGPTASTVTPVTPKHPRIAVRDGELVIVHGPFGAADTSVLQFERFLLPSDPTDAPTLITDTTTLPIDAGYTPIWEHKVRYSDPEHLMLTWVKDITPDPKPILATRLELLGCP